MANVLIAIASIIVAGILATYGAYNSYHSAKRSEYSTRVTHSFNRLGSYIDLTKDDLGHRPAASDLQMSRFASESGSGLTYSFGTTGSYVYVCAKGQMRDWLLEAFQKVQSARPNVVIGNATCDSTGGPSATDISISMRIS